MKIVSFILWKKVTGFLSNSIHNGLPVHLQRTSLDLMHMLVRESGCRLVIGPPNTPGPICCTPWLSLSGTEGPLPMHGWASFCRPGKLRCQCSHRRHLSGKPCSISFPVQRKPRAYYPEPGVMRAAWPSLGIPKPSTVHFGLVSKWTGD